MSTYKGLITGCGRGIGLSCLRLFLESDPSCIAFGISRTETKEISSLKNQYGERLIFNQIDVSDHNSINSFLYDTVEEYGFFDFAILNAGIRSRLSIQSASLDDYRRVFDVNTISNINFVKTLCDLKSGESSLLKILVVSSIVGGRGFDELSTYAVSKAAIDGFVKSAAVELAGKNILLNTINPGFTKSSYADNFKESKQELYEWTLNKTPLGRWADCDEIARLSIFLVSHANTYMTGASIFCDGGWTAQ